MPDERIPPHILRNTPHKAGERIYEERGYRRWVALSKLVDETGELYFTHLPSVMLSILTIPVSQAECERQFSILRKCWSSERDNLSHEALTSLLTLKASGSQQPCHKAQFSKEELQQLRSSDKYDSSAATYSSSHQSCPSSLPHPHILPIPLTFPFIPLIPSLFPLSLLPLSPYPPLYFAITPSLPFP